MDKLLLTDFQVNVGDVVFCSRVIRLLSPLSDSITDPGLIEEIQMNIMALVPTDFAKVKIGLRRESVALEIALRKKRTFEQFSPSFPVSWESYTNLSLKK